MISGRNIVRRIIQMQKALMLSTNYGMTKYFLNNTLIDLLSSHQFTGSILTNNMHYDNNLCSIN